MKYYRLGVVKYNEGFEFGIPDWFLSTAPYYAITQNNEQIADRKVVEVEKNWVELGRPAHSQVELKKEKSFLLKHMDDEQAPQICLSYIQMIDNFVQTGWPVNINNFESIGLCYDAYYLYTKYHQPLVISNALRDAFFDYNTKKGIHYNIIPQMEKMGIIRTSNQYDKLAKELCAALAKYGNAGDVDIIVRWLQEQKIRPQKYERLFCSYFSKPIFTSEYERKLLLLNNLKPYGILHSRMSQIFDDNVRTLNLSEFESYCRFNDNNPSDFISYAFSDGSRMRPVRRFFKWCLQYFCYNKLLGSLKNKLKMQKKSFFASLTK